MSQKLYSTLLKTPLGDMLAIADNRKLYLLEFNDWRKLNQAVDRVLDTTQATLANGKTPVHDTLKTELKDYFKGTLTQFKTTLHLTGTPFQKEVWGLLRKIPYGQTRSYYDIAQLLGKPTAYRAVANANGQNLFPIIIPCHRVINHNGELGGYGGGLDRKKWLLEREGIL